MNYLDPRINAGALFQISTLPTINVIRNLLGCVSVFRDFFTMKSLP
jgi:hypothetical protein